MPSTPLILNEWVIHDLCGENGPECQAETYQFLERVERKCDHLIVLYGSPWWDKACLLANRSSANVSLRLIAKFLWATFLLNSLKCRIFYSSEVPSIMTDMELALPSEDIYLVKLHAAVPDSIIVTSPDAKLVKALSKLPSIRFCQRDEFLTNYM